jgi:two-component system nitrogen regulation response regulator NtrX
LSRILIVDDEDDIRRSLAGILGDEGFETTTAEDGERGIACIEEEGPPDVVLLDIAMPGRDGVEILVELVERWPEVPVVMMSGHGTIETAVRTTRHGAYDFVEKPLSIDKLLLTIQHAVERAGLARENRELRAQALRAHEILGESEAIVKLKQQIEVAAPSNGWVLVTGENGTGKELVARQIHTQSLRSAGPFIEVNCAAIPEELIESELFGHEKGAFTGAVAQKQGKFELAHGGTLFLDEVADMSLMTQAKVLRILQEQTFVRVGGTELLNADVRVVAATNKDLDAEIAAGNFREDLYYRLNVLPFHVPPLRERVQDIPVLARTFVEEFCREAGLPPKKITPAALKLLSGHSWPGNVRELRNLMERVVIMSPRSSIGVDSLPDALRATTSGDGGASLSLEEARRSFERAYLLARLADHGWNISRTAEAIGIARESLSRKIKAYQIEVERG